MRKKKLVTKPLVDVSSNAKPIIPSSHETALHIRIDICSRFRKNSHSLLFALGNYFTFQISFDIYKVMSDWGQWNMYSSKLKNFEATCVRFSTITISDTIIVSFSSSHVCRLDTWVSFVAGFSIIKVTVSQWAQSLNSWVQVVPSPSFLKR